MGIPAKKPTKFMSNSRDILRELSMRCDGSHQHQQLEGCRAEKAAEYPKASCGATRRGLITQLEYARRKVKPLLAIQQCGIPNKGSTDPPCHQDRGKAISSTDVLEPGNDGRVGMQTQRKQML